MPMDSETRIVLAKVCVATLELRSALQHLVAKMDPDETDVALITSMEAAAAALDEAIAEIKRSVEEDPNVN